MKFSVQNAKQYLPLNASRFCKVSRSIQIIEDKPLLAAANSISSSCSSSISSIDSLASLRAVAFSSAALRLTASLSLRSSSFCLLFSACKINPGEEKPKRQGGIKNLSFYAEKSKIQNKCITLVAPQTYSYIFFLQKLFPSFNFTFLLTL